MKNMHLYLAIFIIAMVCSCSNKLKSKNNDRVYESLSVENSKQSDDYQKYKSAYIKNYSKEFLIDTMVFENYSLKVKYYCLFDSSVVISKESSWSSIKKEEFVTHQYALDIQFSRANDILLDTLVTKSDFAPILSKELIEYGVIMKPSLRYMNELIDICVSISIPLTDVGKPACLQLNKSGKIKIH